MLRFLPVFTAFFFCFVASGNGAQAQSNKTFTRIAVTVTDNKTNIWISDFPANTTVMLFDEALTLLGMITTNSYGAAYTSLARPVIATITARTLNGETSAKNQAITHSAAAAEQVAVALNQPDVKG